ncbi:MAG TPA: glycosyltransferase family 9 protein [Acidobacteriota bacterium]
MLAPACIPDSPLQRAQRLLLVRLRSAGDILLLTPALAALKQARPSLLLALLVEERFAALLDGHPHLDCVLSLAKHRPPGRHHWTLMRRLRRFEFDLALDLHGGRRAALYTLLSGAKRRAGEARFRWSRSYHLRLSDSPPGCHTVEHTFHLLAALGLVARPGPLHAALPEAARRRGELLAQQAAAGSSYAVIQPTAARRTRRWESAKFAAVARGLAERGRTVLVSSGPGEAAHASRVVEGAGHPRVRAVCPGDLAELAGLLSGADLFIGNDSGPAHLAAALERPTVVIFGSSDPRRWGPWSERGAPLWRALSCSPCRGRSCARPAAEQLLCLREIGPGAVLAAALALLQARDAGAIEPVAQQRELLGQDAGAAHQMRDRDRQIDNDPDQKNEAEREQSVRRHLDAD